MTIFGESAGSFAVSTLMASPMAQGLFQKALAKAARRFSDVLPDRLRWQSGRRRMTSGWLRWG